MNERLRNLENNVAELRDLKSAYAISDIKMIRKKSGRFGMGCWNLYKSL